MDAREPATCNPAIHHAEGVLATRLGVPIPHAEMILRIRARSRGVTVARMADEVTAPFMYPRDPNISGSC